MLQSPREDDDDQVELDYAGLDIDPESDDCIPLDDSREQVGYELFDWDATDLDLLDDELHAQRIPHEWVTDGFELVVHTDDEATIDALLPTIRFPDELPIMDDDEDGDATDPEVLGRLYDAADRIVRDPRSDGVRLLLDTAEAMGENPPFGIDDRAWDTMVGAVDTIIDALVSDAPPEHIQAAASDLRAKLRPLV